jgi:hypothetical protein
VWSLVDIVEVVCELAHNGLRGGNYQDEYWVLRWKKNLEPIGAWHNRNIKIRKQ